MKKLVLFLVLTLSFFTLAACDDDSDNDENGRQADATINLLTFSHIDGYGKLVERDMPVLFEYEMRDYVKYQVAFISCTCRAPRVNYWSVAYLDISKETGEILFISFQEDGTGQYTAGMWGDSDPIPTGTEKTYEDFKEDFFPWLVGKNSADLDGINIFYDEAPNQYQHEANTTPINEPDMIDAYAGASVSTNNIIRVVKALLDYHDEQYLD